MSTSLTSYSKGVNGDRDNTAYSVNSRNSNIILNNTSNFGNRAPLTATQATATSQKNQSLQLSGSSNINNRLPARTTSNTLVFSGTGNTGSNNLNNSTSNLSVNGNLNKPFAHANTSTNVTNASSTSINNNSSSSNSNNNRRASASAMNGNSQHLYNQQPVNSLTQGINDMKINQHNNMDNEDSSSQQQQQQQWRGSSHAGSSSNAAAAAAARPYGNNEPVPNQQSQQPQQPSHSRASSKTISYSAERVIGNGSFGVVFLAKVVETGEVVAIKKVLQDKRFKNRELQIMRMLNNRNVVQMKHCFYSTGDKPDELYLNLVLEYVPDTVYRFCRQFTKNKEHMPLIYVKLFTFQLCRALNYIHSLGVCHRDIKPQNLLIDPVTGVLKLCDFGSAKQLIPGEPNVSYICSRYYRAPELIFGATNYTTAIDTWSLGCVLAELLIGSPLFPGESSVDQLVEIIKVLGTPTREEIEAMNKNYTEFKFPQVKAQSWNKVFRSHVPPEAIDLVTKFLTYIPEKRVLPIEALAHPFFDELRDPNARLPNMRPLPPLFDFTPDELKMLKNPELKSKIFPPHHQFNNL